MLCRIWTSRLPITCLMSMEVFDVASAACLVILFNVCHHHEPQPSTALSVYLALDFAAKTIFLWRHDGASPWADWRFVSILVLLLKLRLIQLQERSKKDRVGLPNSGFWSSRLGFSILPLLYQARNGPLSKDNIADIPHELHNGRLNRKFEALWSKCRCSTEYCIFGTNSFLSDRSKKHPLFMVTTMSCKAELFQGILVTVLKSIIKFSIPFWIESVVRFLEHRQTTQSHTGALDIETICVTLQTLTLFLSLAVRISLRLARTQANAMPIDIAILRNLDKQQRSSQVERHVSLRTIEQNVWFSRSSTSRTHAPIASNK